MSVLKFPLEPAQSTGVFWLAGSDASKTSGGVCRIDGSDIEIEMTHPLTPWMEWVGDAHSMRARRMPEQKDLVVLGQLPIFPGPLTFVGAHTVGRRAMSIRGGPNAPELHRLKADWCIAGAHLEEADMRFGAVRVRLTHLELWARTQDLEMIQSTQPPLKTTVVYVPVNASEAAFAEYGESATLRLESGATIGMPSSWGTYIKTHDWLGLQGLSGWTLTEIFARFVRPVQALLTLLAGAVCDVLQLEVKVGDRWCAVYGGPIRPGATQPEEDQLLLEKAEMPLNLIGVWCGLVGKLTPAPHVIAAATARDFATVDSEALALTTTAEGMDRVLHPGARRFSEDDVTLAIAELEGSNVPPDVRKALVDALKQYFYEDSYPARMRRLADRVSAVVPSCIGKPNKWKAQIANLRIELAHALGNEPESSDRAILGMHARNLSLRWALLIRMLLETGVPPEVLGEAIEKSDRYRRDSKVWRKQMPKVFVSDTR